MHSVRENGTRGSGVNNLKRSMTRGAAVAALAAAWLAGPVGAQTLGDTTPATSPSAAAANGPQGDAAEVVVTGTRIRRPDLESNSPLTTLGQGEIKYEGAVNVESVLNRLPQFTADANENVSNGSDGTANVNLRNLGSARVLILLNGQRLLPQQAVDLNFVPSSLIQRVDVVTGGASAVYGSDALSGVVNFILRDDLNGFHADVQNGFFTHDNGDDYLRGLNAARGYKPAPLSTVDGGKQDLNLAYGKTFADGRGNITAYGGYRHTDPVLQASRDYSSCALSAADAAGTGLTCLGSSNTTIGTFAPLTGPSAGVGYLSNSPTGGKTWVPYSADYAYNYAPTSYIQRADRRYTAGAFAKFKFVDAAELYGSFMYMNDRTFSQVAPSALFLGSAFNLSCDNPLMGASQQTALCGPAAGTPATEQTLIGYRLNNDYSRRDDLRHTDFRYTAGLRGDLGHGFGYDVNYVHSLVRFDETYLNNVDVVKAQRALDAVSVNGTPTCRSVVDGSDPACVPIDVFQANGISSDQARYLFSPSNTHGRNTQTVISGTLTGDLGTFGIQSPWAERGVNIALGAEHRRETLLFTVDAVALQNGTLPADGTITVNEGYGEIEVPILAHSRFAEALTLNGGARYSAYHNEQGSTGFQSSYNVWTYKTELNYAPTRDVRLRASYNRAIRAPNIGELFASRGVGNVALDDPCAGSSPAASLAVCKLTGVSDAQYAHIIQCPADTCSALGGGNAAVKPEKGDTYTVGLVLTPRQIRNLSLSVDYYHIKVKDYISSIDPSLAASACVSSGDPFYCQLFHRDPQSGALFGSTTTGGYVVSTTLNTGYLFTSGIDVNVDYTFGIGRLGKINANAVGTWTMHQVAEPLPGLGTYDCKGFFGYTCGQPNPEWRHVARLTWLLPQDRATLSLSWRFFEGTRLSSLSSNPLLAGAGSIINARIPTYNYFDLAGTIRVAKQLQLRAGINNIADKNPPAIAAGILSSFGNGNTYPGVFDPLGRNIFVGATVDF